MTSVRQFFFAGRSMIGRLLHFFIPMYVLVTGASPAQAYFIEPGDADAECYVTDNDVLLIINIALGLIPPESVPGDPDCSGDGEISVVDVNCAIIKELANVYSSECVGAWIPPDPSLNAPTLDTLQPFAHSVAFLYSGPNVVQGNLETDPFLEDDVAVIRGKTTTRSGITIRGVEITVNGDPRYGYTKTRNDGAFDIVVNGGGVVTLNYSKVGYLPAQRTLTVSKNDFNWVDTVAMMPLDSVRTTINFGSAALKSHQSTQSSDSAGTRRATVLVPPGTTGVLEFGDGTTQALTSMRLRSSEYTVGPNGPKAMPAPLPLTTGYTYAVELSADEAIAQGAVTVAFNQPIFLYVENFLEFPSGGVVPAGYYDFQKAAWVPSLNGRVVTVTAIEQGLAQLDVDDDPAATAWLASHGIAVSDSERQALATLYDVGQSLWRVPIPHLTPWDCNWPYGPPEGAIAPGDGVDDEGDDDEEDGGAKSENQEPDECDKTASGSIIECTNGVLIEKLPLAGLPFSLVYRSDRVPGHRESYIAKITLHKAGLPEPLPLRIDLEVQIAGQKHTSSFQPTSEEQVTTFEWDGRNGYGQPVEDATTADIAIGYVYQAQYYSPSDFDAAFGSLPDGAITGFGNSREVTIWAHHSTTLGIPAMRNRQLLGLGGWTIDALQDVKVGSYGTKFKGNVPPTVGTTVSTIDVDVLTLDQPDQHHDDCHDVAVGPDGRVICLAVNTTQESGYVFHDTTLRMFDSIGEETEVHVAHYSYVLWPWPWDWTDPEVENRPRRIASLKVRGSIAYVLYYFGRVVKFDLSTGQFLEQTPPLGYSGPGIFRDLEVDVEGNIYFAGDLSWGPADARILKLSPSGVVEEIRDPAFYSRPAFLALHPNGRELYVGKESRDGADFYYRNKLALELGQEELDPWLSCEDIDPRVHAVSLETGVVRPVIGTKLGCDVDNGPYAYTFPGARNFVGSALDFPMSWTSSRSDITFDDEGNLYLADDTPHAPNASERIFQVRDDGLMAPRFGALTQAGTYSNTPSINAIHSAPPGTWPNLTRFGFHFYSYGLGNLAVSNGVFYLNDTVDYQGHHKGLVSLTPTPVFIPLAPELDDLNYAIAPNENHSVYHVFNDQKAHIMDLDAYSGQPLMEMQYDQQGRIISLVDAEGNTVSLTHGSGSVAIDAFGMTHQLTLNAQGYLASLTYPDGATYNFTYHTSAARVGLMNRLTRPNGATYNSGFLYDDKGRLTKDTNAEGIYTELAKQDTADGFTVTRSTAEGRQIIYDSFVDQDDADVVESTLVVDGFGGPKLTEIAHPDGTGTMVLADGSVLHAKIGPHPVHGEGAPFVEELSLETPSGLSQEVESSYAFEPPTAAFGWDLTSETLELTINGDDSHPIRLHVNRETKELELTTREGRSLELQCDYLKRPLSLTLPGVLPIEMDYDPSGRVTHVRQGTYVVQYDYDEISPFASAIGYGQGGGPHGEWYDLERDEVGRVSRVTGQGAELDVSYDLHGNPTSISKLHDQADNAPEGYAWTWDKADQATSATLPQLVELGDTSLYEYDFDGLFTAKTFPDGSVVDVEYDDAGRPKVLTYPDGAFELEYDSTTGQLTLVEDDTGSLGYEYDGFLLTDIHSSHMDVAASIGFTYDDEWNVTLLDVQGISTAYVYDRDRHVREAGLATLEYDPDGALNGFLWKSNLLNLTTEVEYDAYGRRSTLSTTHAGGAFGYERLHGYSDYRQHSSLTEEITVGAVQRSVQWTYAYDSLRRLSGAQRVATGEPTKTFAYAYDWNGNRLEAEEDDGGGPALTAASYDARDRLLQHGSTAFTWSENGSLLSKTTLDGTTSYGYDIFKGLHHVDLPGGGPTPEIAYSLDPTGRRIAKRYNGTVVRRWAYLSFLRPVAELDEQGNVETLFVYTTESHTPGHMERAGTTYRLLTNAQGSVRFVVDASTGVVAQELEYDPFGQVIKDTNPGFQPFGFAGGLYDHHTGLVRFGHRDYDAETGRWTADDPIGIGGGDTNYYAYAGNDPVNFVDRNGLMRFDYFPEPPTPAERAAAAAARSEFYESVGDSVKDLVNMIGHEIAQSPPGPAMGIGFGKGFLKWLAKKLGKKKAKALGSLTDEALELIDDGCEEVLKKVDDVPMGAAPGEYLAGKAPMQVTPGTHTLTGQHVNDLGRVEPWTAHFDEFGRLKARTDFNACCVARPAPVPVASGMAVRRAEEVRRWVGGVSCVKWALR